MPAARSRAAPTNVSRLLEILIRYDVSSTTPQKGSFARLTATFGEDRVVFGTDWPNSWGVVTPAEIVALARAYFAIRTRDAAEKFFWRNSLSACGWHNRAANQPD
jgi:predicted TIM-barrel fold metal-dependent hydrolase